MSDFDPRALVAAVAGSGARYAIIGGVAVASVPSSDSSRALPPSRSQRRARSRFSSTLVGLKRLANRPLDRADLAALEEIHGELPEGSR